MAAFASVEDLEDRWRTLSSSEEAQAAVLLEDASAMIRATCPDVGEVDADVLRMIVCAMVKRTMLASDAPGVRAAQETAGPFSQSYTYANPMGDLYLTGAEKRLLGCGRQVGFTVPMSDWFDPDEGS